MNFTKREKKILTILAILLPIVLYYNLILMPTLKSIKKLNQEIKQYQTDFDKNILFKEEIANIDKELKILYQKMQNIRENFPPYLETNELLVLINYISKNIGIKIDSYSFKEPVPVDYTNTSGNKEDSKEPNEQSPITSKQIIDAAANLGIPILNGASKKENNNKTVIMNGQGYYISLNINGSGSESQINTFLDIINNLRNKTAIKEVQISSSENDACKFTLSLNFYGIRDPVEKNKYSILTDEMRKVAQPKNPPSIFSLYDPQISINSNSQTNENITFSSPNELKKILSGNTSTNDEYNFFVYVRPCLEGVAPPSVAVLSKSITSPSSDTEDLTIYSDNKFQEKVTFTFVEENGNLKCKYSAGNSNFPSGSTAKLADFTVNGDTIKILITSMPRKFANDTSGIDLYVENNTSKKIVIDVTEEDKDKPRVKIQNAGFNSVVNYK